MSKNNNVVEILKDMGIAYVSFFVDNPAYFQFLYSQSNIKIDLSLSIPDDQNYKPYIIYKNIVSKLLEQSHYPEEKQNDIIITIWAFIHGITSLATMNNVNYDNDVIVNLQQQMFKQQSDVPFDQDEENKDDETGNDTDTKNDASNVKGNKQNSSIPN